MTTMVCENNFCGLIPRLVEPDVNHMASEFISNNFSDVVRNVRRMGVKPEFAVDLVNDTYIALVEREECGDGFDPYFFPDTNYSDPNWMEKALKKFVYGALSRTRKNDAYKTTSQVNKSSNEEYHIEIHAASSNGEELDKMSPLQKAYMNSAVEFTGFEDIDNEDSVIADVRYCMGLNDKLGFDMLSFFDNLESIGGRLEELNAGQNQKRPGQKRSKAYNTSTLDGIKNLVTTNREFKWAFIRVVRASAQDKEEFKHIIDIIRQEREGEAVKAQPYSGEYREEQADSVSVSVEDAVKKADVTVAAYA